MNMIRHGEEMEPLYLEHVTLVSLLTTSIEWRHMSMLTRAARYLHNHTSQD